MPNLLTQLFELLFYLAGPILLAFLAFFSSTLLHELGHAVPVLFMTRGRVEIYVGSLGKPTNSLKCHIGRLDMFLGYNPLAWGKGICKPPRETLAVYKRILYIATGPLTSLALALTCWYFLAVFDVGGLFRLILLLLLLAASAHTVSTSIPIRYRNKMSNGQKMMSDAALILYLIKNRHLPYEYWQSAELIKQNNFLEAATLLDNILAAGHTDINIYRHAIYAHLQLQNGEKAIEIIEAFKTLHTLNADDYSNEGLARFRLHRPEEAFQSSQKALELDPNHVQALNIRGYLLCTMNRYAEALIDFEKAISLSPEFAYAFNNRGWAKIKLGQLEEGLADVNHSLIMDPTNAHAYRNLGLYHIRKNEPDKAIELLSKSKDMDPTTDLVDEYLVEAHEQLKSKTGNSL